MIPSKRSGKFAAVATQTFFAALLATGCSSNSIRTPSEPIRAQDLASNWQILPYHVAVIPLRAEEVQVQNAGADSTVQIDLTEGLGKRGPNDITQQVVEVLEGNIFSKVTVLPNPSWDLGPEYHDSYWAAAAIECGADLVMDFDSLVYSKGVKSKARPISYLLYFTGPLELLFPDRNYKTEQATLAVTLFDGTRLRMPVGVRNIEGLREVLQGEGMEKRAAQLRAFNLYGEAHKVRQFRLQPEPIALHYADRLPMGSSGILRFWKSMIIPSAWLEKSTPRVSEDLSERFAMGLANDLAREIVGGDHEFILTPDATLAGFRYDARGATIEITDDFLVFSDRIEVNQESGGIGDGKVLFDGAEYQLELLPEGRKPEEVARPGVAAFQLTPRTAQPTGQYDMRIYVPIAAGSDVVRVATIGKRTPAESIQLQLVDGARNDRSQSWTHVLAPAERKAAQKLSAVGAVRAINPSRL